MTAKLITPNTVLADPHFYYKQHKVFCVVKKVEEETQ